MRLSLLALFLVLAGCNASAPRPTIRHVTLPDKIEISKPQFATQRFLPTNSGDLAFDTKNGRLCKTWYWGEERQEPRSAVGQPQFVADVCDSVYHADWTDDTQKDRENRDFQREQWAHEEKMAGKHTPPKPNQ